LHGIEKYRRLLDDYLRPDNREPYLKDLRVFTGNATLFRLFLANLRARAAYLQGERCEPGVEKPRFR
jgi:hypothetical protein